MNIFNSLGSNYSTKSIWQALTLANKSSHSQELIAYLEKKYTGKVVLLYKNREAIRLGLELVKLPKSSCIAFCGYSCYVVDQAITTAGLKPIYLDIDPDTLNFTPQSLELAVQANPNIKAVIIQNTLGYPCDIVAIQKICQKSKLILIEDLAHSAGGKYANEKEIGTIGDITVLSFSQDKSIDSISGGALIVRNPKIKLNLPKLNQIPVIKQLQDRFYPLLTASIRALYPYKIGKYWHWFLKRMRALSVPIDPEDINYQQLPHWQAKLALDYFSQLNQINAHRQTIAHVYGNRLGINLRFPIFVKNRDSLIGYLKNHGVYVSDIWYDTPISPAGMCPNAEKIADTILNLPTHIHVSPKEAKKIINLIHQWHQQNLSGNK